MLISYVLRGYNAPFTSVPSPCHVECLLIWCWCHGYCPKRPSNNSWIHLYKRCVSVPMLKPFIFWGYNGPFTSVPSPCHVECQIVWCRCNGNCLKWPSNNSLIHFYKRCVSVPMITSFIFRGKNAPFTSVCQHPILLLGPLIRQCVSVMLTSFLYKRHDSESMNRSFICLIWGVSLISGFFWWLLDY